MAQATGRVLVDVIEGRALVTLNDPDRRNALDLALCEEIGHVFDELERRTDITALVLTGHGSAFCAGADLSHLRHSEREGLLAIYEGFLRVARTPIPTIAAVNGPAVGAGMNLALACDVRIVCPSAKFDARFLDLGVHPGGGHTWMLQRLAGAEAAFAAVLFGEVLVGEEIVEHGLAWRCVPDSELVREARRVAARAAAAPRELVLRVKQTIRDVAVFDDHGSAVHRELEDQVWSVREPAFQQRLVALQKAVSGRVSNP